MISFALSGTLACVLTIAPDELTLAISSPLQQRGAWPCIAWILCTAREAALRSTILDGFRSGDLVRVEGHIERRRRKVGELAFHSVGFIAHSIERLPSPADEAAA